MLRLFPNFGVFEYGFILDLLLLEGVSSWASFVCVKHGLASTPVGPIEWRRGPNPPKSGPVGG
jgi:hypothetical protein